MKRRDMLTAAGALALTSCASKSDCEGASGNTERFSWKMVTTWPPNFPGMGSGVTRMVEQIERASGGRLEIHVYAAGELVPAMEVFDTVSRGAAEIGHGPAYYWKNKSPATPFFTTIPFGMTAMEMNGWLYFGGGLELYRELYGRFNLLPFPAGNTGVQMGGWFNREINSVADLKGLRMRIPGLGGDVLARAGGSPVTLPGGEVFTALQTGAIDATEWVGPYNDMIMGLQDAARFYYYPGWQEPGPTLECIVNKDAWAKLPPDLQAIVELAASALNDQMTAEFSARNAEYLAELEQENKVQLREFPGEVLATLRGYMDEIVAELVASNPEIAKIHASYSAYKQKAARWSAISEQAYLNSRDA